MELTRRSATVPIVVDLFRTDSCFQTVPQIKKSIRRMITAARHRSGSTIDISYDDDRSSSIVELSPEYANPAPHPALPPALPSVPDELFNQVSSRKSSRVSSTGRQKLFLGYITAFFLIGPYIM